MKGSDHLEDLGIDERIMSKWIIRNRVKGFTLNSSGSGQGPVVTFVNTVMNLQF
jgi:hypothetical protein